MGLEGEDYDERKMYYGSLLVAARPTGDIDYLRRASTLILKTCYSSSFCSVGAFMVDAE